MISHLRALAQLISDGCDKIESLCATREQSYPSLDDPYTPATTAIQAQMAADAAPVIAAAYQLIATLTHPDPYLFNWGLSVRTHVGLHTRWPVLVLISEP